MDLIESARKHGVPDPDIWHAYRWPILIHRFDGYDIYIGPSTSGALLEVGVSQDRQVIFHCKTARPKFLPQRR